jgi:carboxyl-terminal processing protease
VIPLRRGLLGLGALVVLLAAFIAGIYVDQSYPGYVPVLRLGAPPRAQLDRATTDQALRVIQANYYDAQVNYAKLSSGSVRGIVQALGDPYTQYLSPDEYRAQLDQYAGKHSGMVGIVVNFKDGYPVVSGVLPNSPALHAGLKTDDVIVRINGTDTRNLSQDQTATLIRGPAGTTVTLRVSRSGTLLDIPVTRANFQSPTVQSVRLEDGALYMRIYQFGETTQTEFDDQLRAGLPGAKAVVLDLRDDGGGFVDKARAVISRFVSTGEAFEQRGRDGQVEKTYVDGNHPAGSVPLAVLVNENTASASEIVSGALQARSRAQLVGTKTFGKGSVQMDYQLSDGGDLHLTVAHWFLPNGQSIDKQGLTPNVAVSLPDKQSMFDPVLPARGHAADAQLNRALALVVPQ